MGKLRDDFVKEARKLNKTFERFVRSSLRPTMNILDRFPDPVAGLPVAPRKPKDLADLKKAINTLKTRRKAKYDRYKDALVWLEGKVQGLQGSVEGRVIAIGRTTDGYVAGKEVRRQDRDNRWWNYHLQEKGNSCGPTCVRTILLLRSERRVIPGETTVRNMMGLVEQGDANKGISVSAHDWELRGSEVPSIISVLRSYGVRDARTVCGSANIARELAKCSRNNPGIVGWWWGPAKNVHHDAWDPEGHWTTCVGPTEDGLDFVILDPWTQVGYIRANNFSLYNPPGGGGSVGWFNPEDLTQPAVIVTHPPERARRW